MKNGFFYWFRLGDLTADVDERKRQPNRSTAFIVAPLLAVKACLKGKIDSIGLIYTYELGQTAGDRREHPVHQVRTQ